MGRTLVIVESPAKAKTIGRYLGEHYRIEASVGHVRDLPSSSLGVDVEHEYKPRYINMKGKDKVIRELKDDAKTADRVLIATDPDREGEAIAWHLSTLLKIDPASDCRVTFNEITEKAVKEAIMHPRAIDMNLVDAQQARRILDRLVGYELSPLLWKKVRTGLSAGRVQSVATKLVVDREEEINRFKPEEYWLLQVKLETAARESFTARYQGVLKHDKLEKVRLLNKEMTDAVIRDIKDNEFQVQRIKKGQKQRQPYAPFTTSTLQQEAARRLSFSSKKTMSVAQQIYEGVDIPGQGATALVTYIRTDSVRISQEALTAARELIGKHYGAAYVPKQPRLFKNRHSAQDAHEAIRPAHFELSPQELERHLTRDQYRLYKLIWERFLASQMSAARIDTLVVDTVCQQQLFRSSGERVVFPGFLAAYADIKLDQAEQQAEAEDSNKDDSNKADNPEEIPALEEGQSLKNLLTTPTQKFTQPPARYTEASLIKAMEEKGIGRPSTYAPTISTILARKYVEKQQRQLLPTNLGTVVTHLLADNFKDIVDVAFTAGMESKLDIVEEGKENWVKVLDAFYPPFHKEVEHAAEHVDRVKMPVVQLEEKCPECGGNLVIKEGRYGKFVACSNFPECKYTRNLAEKVNAHCPLCGSGLETRKSRRGSTFYVCDKKGSDPDCKFISWDLPIDGQKCETCGAYMVFKRFRGRSFPKCSNPDCPTNARSKKKKTEAAQPSEKTAQQTQEGEA
ncbi:MAG: type I DNA topoisomerase [Oscillospiraceae bacterium]|nr:type I DNA topoisomerase [Oscillospiraceae bacterium]MDD4367970.1 type I DNA topoisomerase [Oscillospiraceae bacterium]